METREKAIELLGQGIPNRAVAQALGITEARISQMLAQKDFREAVTSRKIGQLQDATDRDTRYAKLEDGLIEKLEKAMPMMMRPGEILKAIQIVNGTKRRGAASAVSDNVVGGNTVIQLNIPQQIIHQFTTDSAKQVVQVSAGQTQQELVTLQSGQLVDMVKNKPPAIEDLTAEDL